MDNNIRILHLEDDVLDAELVQATLRSAEMACQITRVESRAEFTQALQQGGYDVILADYHLPTYDGMLALRLAQEHYPEMPFIFVSGVLGEDAAIDGLTQGATDYVLKQKLSRLAPAVKRALREAENRKERQRAETALRESEARYRRITEAITDYIYTVRVEGGNAVETRHGPGCLAVTGYPAEDFAADPYLWIHMVVEADRPAVQEQARRILASEATPAIEHRIVRKDGTLRWVRNTPVPRRDAQGVLRSYDGLIQDITERKQAEEALRESEANYRRIVETATEGIWGIGPDTMTTFVNARMAEMLGYQSKEMIGRPTTDFMFEEDTHDHLRKMENRRQSIPENYECRFRCKDGQTVWVLASATPIFDAEHDFKGSFAMLADITARKQAEEALRRLNRELRALSTCNQILIRAVDEQTLLNDICRIICDEAGYRMAWVGYAAHDDAKTVRPIAWAGTTEGYLTNANITWADTERGRGVTGVVIRTGVNICIQDFMTDPQAAPWREDALRCGYRSSLAVPLKDENAATFGALTIYAAEPNAFTPDEIRLLEELANDLAFGITILRVRIERKRAEEALQKERNLLRTLITNMPDYVYVKDRESRFVLVNAASLHAFDAATVEELVGKTDFDFLPQEYARKFYTDEQAIIASGEPLINCEEQSIESNTGRPVWFSTTKVPLRDTHGDVTGIIGVTRDITDRKRVEEALKDQYSTLRSIIDSANALIFSVDRQYRYTSFNTGHAVVMRVLYGAEIEIGHNQLEYMTVTADRETAKRNLDRALAGEQIVEEAYSGEELRSQQYFQVSHSPIKTETGEVIGVAVLAQDMTARKRAEEELRRYREHLEELVAERTEALEQEILERKHVEHALQQAKDAAEFANRAKSVFLANMNHELRTPLNAILGFAQLLWRDPQTTAAQQEYLDIILRSGEYLLRLINDVLEIARIEAGRIELHPEACDVDTLIRDVMDMMRNRADAKQLQLTLKQSSDLPRHIHADASKLRQILVNLIGNAIKFTETGGVTVRVGANLCVRPENGQGQTQRSAPATILYFEIADTGVGIAPEDQERIFKPFEQVGTMSEAKGAGLGLTITRQYIELMGGSIAVESPPASGGEAPSIPPACGGEGKGGPGSVFRFEIPVQPLAVEAIPRAQLPHGVVIGLEPGQPTYRILIVEDQFEIRVLLRNILEPVGFEVREAVNGAEAIQMFRDWQPQVIFMDWRMPGMDGLEAMRRIKTLEDGYEVVIIMLTASAFKEQRDEALTAGSDDFLSKPFREEDIFQTLWKHLGVQYVYADGDAQMVKDLRPQGLVETQDLASLLARLPSELLSPLEHAASQGNVRMVELAIAAIRPCDVAAAAALATLAKDFHYEEIWTMLQMMKEKNHA